MADDDIERLIAEMDALNAQAEKALTAKPGGAVEPRRGAEPVPTRAAGGAGREGLPPAILRALIVSGVATGLVWVVFALLPFVGLSVGSLPAVFGACLLVAAFYVLRGRG
jgi:hypothetical protein